jgi:tagatose 6-phosphate kinase
MWRMPKLILTATLNPSLDKTVTIRRFCAGHTFVVADSIISAGGKGINVSRVLRHLKFKTCAIGLLGGSAGRIFGQLLARERITHDFVPIRYETRTNLTIMDSYSRRTRILEAGPKVRPADINRFKKIYRKWLKQSCFVVLSGRNAQGASDFLYAELIYLAKKENVPSILDTSGPSLRAGLKAKPFMIKLNVDEAQEALGFRLDTLCRVKKAVGQFHRLGIGMVVISMNRDGAVGSDQREMWHVRTPKIWAKNDVGCGDALLAGFLYAYLRRRPFREVLRWAVAAGTANTRTLVPGQICRDDLDKFFKAVFAKRL